MQHEFPPELPQRRRRRRSCLPAVVVFLLSISAIVLLAVQLWPAAQRWQLELRHPLRYEELIFRYSEEHDLDPFLVMGVIQAESSFRPTAVSPMGATGLMQIMPATGEWLAGRMGVSFTETDLMHPAYNVRMGTYYLRLLIDMFGHVDTALAAYNAGMGNVSTWLADEQYSHDGETLHTIPFTETREYVERVNRFMEIYRELYG
ncbi:MAG: lytic transglycosylase domain-containing protein [Oscillospiraceae bacterium]|nr:lytic transglycosylase domain-containing protein [Oscillospiraceae bacterium]